MDTVLEQARQLCVVESEMLLGTGWEIGDGAQGGCVLGSECWLHMFVCDGPVSHTLLKRTPSCMYITAHQSLQMKIGMGTPASNLHIQEPRPWVPRS